jgi:hypothetical protein
MKTLALLVMATLAAAVVAGCGNSSSPAAPTQASTPAQVTGLTTPQSVSVVTAN